MCVGFPWGFKRKTGGENEDGVIEDGAMTVAIVVGTGGFACGRSVLFGDDLDGDVEITLGDIKRECDDEEAREAAGGVLAACNVGRGGSTYDLLRKGRWRRKRWMAMAAWPWRAADRAMRVWGTLV